MGKSPLFIVKSPFFIPVSDTTEAPQIDSLGEFAFWQLHKLHGEGSRETTQNLGDGGDTCLVSATFRSDFPPLENHVFDTIKILYIYTSV